MGRFGKALVITSTLLLSSGSAHGARDVPGTISAMTDDPRRAVITDAGRRYTQAEEGVRVDLLEDRIAQHRLITTTLSETAVYPRMHFTYEGRAVCTPPALTDCLYRFDDGVQEPHTRSPAQYAAADDFMPRNQAEYAALRDSILPAIDGKGNDLAWRADGEHLVRLVEALKDNAVSRGDVTFTPTGNPPGSTGYQRVYRYGESSATLRHNTGNDKNEYQLALVLDPGDFPARTRDGAVHTEQLTLASPLPEPRGSGDYLLIAWRDGSLGRRYTHGTHGGTTVYREKQERARTLIDELR